LATFLFGPVGWLLGMLTEAMAQRRANLERV
jgi:hypothetical protein